MENTKITFYKIKQCGLFLGSNSNKKVASDINHLLPSLKKWIKGKGIKLTKTHSPIEGKPLPAYVVDIVNQDNDWLIVLWNEIESTEGTVATVPMDAPVGTTQIEMTDLPENSIPGFATYFWIIPENNLIATIRFQHSQNGSYQLSKLIKGFYENFSEYVVFSGENSSIAMNKIGYKVDDQFYEICHSKFSLELIKNNGPIDYIIKNHSQITKIIKKDIINIKHKNRKSYWQKVLKTIGLNNKISHTSSLKEEFRVEIRSDVNNVTEEELKGIISKWKSDDMDTSDYGFKICGNEYWLSKSYIKDELQLDIKRHNSEIVDFHELLKELGRYKQNFISKI